VNRTSRSVVGVLLGFAVVACLAAAAQATVPGKNGLIVFLHPIGGRDQIYTMHADGTHVHQLTNFTDSAASDVSWSADGKRLAFARDFAVGKPDEHLDIYTMNADGTGLHAMGLKGLNGRPLWFPDGRRLLFSRIGGLWVIPAAGGTPHQVLKIAGDYDDGAFSPDGKQVVVLRHQKGKGALFIATLGNGSMKQITSWNLDANEKVDWSPDGSRILSRNTHEIFTVRPDGSGLTVLFRGHDYCSDSFSPDGRKVAFIDHCSTEGASSEILTMNLDGTDVARIPNVHGHWVGWAPAVTAP